MSENINFQYIGCKGEKFLNVVFVHGLTGSAKDTWTAGSSAVFWPGWLIEEIPGASIYTLGYPASIFTKWAEKEMDMFERAANTLEYFAGKEIDSFPLVFIAHSLGGILTKMILRKSVDSNDNNWKAVSLKTESVIFLSTPHSGAALANVLNVLPFSSHHIKLLTNNTGFLNDLNEYYRNFANRKPGFKTIVFYEKHKTKNSVLVVDKSSADPGVAEAICIAVDKDHINICKPDSKEDIVYLSIKRHINEIIKNIKNKSDNSRLNSKNVKIDKAEKLNDKINRNFFEIKNGINFVPKCAELTISTTQGSTRETFHLLPELRFGVCDFNVDGILISYGINAALLEAKLENCNIAQGPRLGDEQEIDPHVSAQGGNTWEIIGPKEDGILRRRALGAKPLCLVEAKSTMDAQIDLELSCRKLNIKYKIVDIDSNISLTEHRIMEIFFSKILSNENEEIILSKISIAIGN